MIAAAAAGDDLQHVCLPISEHHHHTALPNPVAHLVHPLRPSLVPAGEPARIITAAELAAADIVLTTYEVLRRDVHLSSDEYASAAARTLRGRKKYHVSLPHV